MIKRLLISLIWLIAVACTHPPAPAIATTLPPTDTPTASPSLPTTSALTVAPTSPDSGLRAAGAFVIMGDSWAAQLGLGLESELRARGFDGHYYAVGAGGSTSALWLADDNGRLTRVERILHTEDDNQPLLLVFLGGNDLIDGYLAEGQAVLSRIDANLRAILTEIRAASPKTHIIISSYDFFPQLCQAPLSRAGLTTPEAANAVLLQMGQLYAAMAATDEHITYVDLWGTLPGAGSSGTRDQQWSDNAYYRDCVHPTSEGFKRFGAALLDNLEDKLRVR